MDTIMDIKGEDPLPDDIASQNEQVFCTKNATMKSNSDTELLHNVSFVAIKTGIKSETTFSNFCVQEEGESFAKNPTNQVGCETVTYSYNCGIDTKTELGSQNEREFLPEDPAMRVQKYNKDDEMGSEIEIKEEPWWLETDTSPMYNDIKDGDFTAVKSSGFCTEASSRNTTDDSLLPSAETSEKTPTFSYGKDSRECESQESVVKEILPIEHVHSKERGKCSREGDIYSKAFLILQDGSPQEHNTLDKSSNQLSPVKFNNLIDDGKKCYKCEICDKKFIRLSSLKSHNLMHDKKAYKCTICGKSFTNSSSLKSHNMIHEGSRSHKCEICEKSFSRLSNLKSHMMIHEGKKPHKCGICEKSCTRLSDLKRHHLVHEGKKPYECEICEKSFIWLSDLKRHHLVHEGKKPHKCEICEKSFTRLSNLKSHNLIHDGTKPHKCEICERSFTNSSSLKLHNLVHEGIKPHKCKECDKRYTRLSELNRHNLIHECKKPYKCEVCEKSFARLSSLKLHNLIHEGSRSHKCKICEKSFYWLSHLKLHNMIHEGKKPHKCEICEKSFTRLSDLKRHHLVHEGKKPH